MPRLRAIAIVARERSGSTVFQSFVSSYPGHKSIGEIWNYGVPDNAFYDFCVEQIIRDPLLIRPDKRLALFQMYLERESEAFTKTVVFDQKYGHLDLAAEWMGPRFDAEGRALVRVPAVLRHLMEGQVPIIHLIRRNKLRLFVSLARASAQGVWHVRGRPAGPGEPVAIDPEKALSFVAYEVRFSNLIDQFLKGYRRGMTLEYETLFTDDHARIKPVHVEAIAALLGLDPALFDSVLPLARTNPFPLSAVVAGYDALAAAFRETPHAWMLED